MFGPQWHMQTDLDECNSSGLFAGIQAIIYLDLENSQHNFIALFKTYEFSILPGVETDWFSKLGMFSEIQVLPPIF